MFEKEALNRALSGIVLKRRKEMGISQETLSVKAGLDRTFVSKVEKIGRNPRLDSIFRLSSALGVLPEELIKEIRERAEELAAADVQDGREGSE